MLFRKVQGDQLNNFDPETVEFYKKRASPEHLTTRFLTMNREYRNRLPVLASKDHPFVKEHDAYLSSLPTKVLLAFSFFSFATYQFSKIYFPYGIIVRRSIPQTWG